MNRPRDWWKASLVAGFVVWSVSCRPTLDPALSPPIIHKPLYGCSQVIAYSGADRDARIHVYVNGTKVMEHNSWLGWGAIKLPTALTAGDVVTAAQQVGSRISYPTRDPVTAVVISSQEAPQGKLNTPEVVAPLYECQRVVRVSKTLPGAEVVLRNNDGTTWKGMTPYTVIRQGTPELKSGQWYNAMQQICVDPQYVSDWSAKETVKPKPAALPKPVIHKPIVAGSDAIRVDDLMPGAVVEILDPGGNKVGGGIAAEPATIFKVSPVLVGGVEYKATQALCDLVSDPSDPEKPVPVAPAPRVQKPLCAGGHYVTVCDTAVMTTVKVLIGGNRVAQAAGNGGCVKLALGDATVLADGDSVTALQEVAGSPSTPSAAVVVGIDASPSYNPGYWNNPAYVGCNNCYNYGTDLRTDTFAQPGKAHGAAASTMSCPAVGNGAVADGLVAAVENQCTGCTHRVALVVAPGVPGDTAYAKDYHWYRLDDTGRWSHKPGPGKATDLDASGNPIADPQTADRTYKYGPDYILDYSTFCTYYCVDKNVVTIDGWGSCP